VTTFAFAVTLAVGSAFGLVAALTATPEQANVPPVSFLEGPASQPTP
jgi:hypothetical protein